MMRYPLPGSQGGQSQGEHAFALSEAVMLVLVAGVAGSLLLVGGATTRSSAGLNRDLGNLRQIGQLTFAFASDNEDRYPMVSEAPDSQWPDLRPVPGENVGNAAKHAIDIIRRRTGRQNFPLPTNWMVHVNYGHLALQDYAGVRLPARTWVSAGDVHRMNWTGDPVSKHDLGFWQPYQQPTGGKVGAAIPDGEKRWPYSSSYETPPAWFDAGQSDWKSRAGRISQGSSHNSYFIPVDANLGGQPLSRVAFPSQKVMVHDYADWYHTQAPRYFGEQINTAQGFSSLRAPTLMTDGGVTLHWSREANVGWDPRTPSSIGRTRFAYTPRDWEPPTSTGSPAILIDAGFYRWTRGGLRGRDFGGAEIDTGQRP